MRGIPTPFEVGASHAARSRARLLGTASKGDGARFLGNVICGTEKQRDRAQLERHVSPRRRDRLPKMESQMQTFRETLAHADNWRKIGDY
jgi:hypothetical protein